MENKEKLEQAAEKYVDTKHKPAAGTPNKGIQNFYDCRTAFKDGAKWQQEQDKYKYTEEEVMNMFHTLSMHLPLHYEFLVKEQFKKK